MTRPSVGDTVRILGKDLPFEYGVVTGIDTSKGGCYVRPEGSSSSFGWDFSELEIVMQPDEGTRRVRAKEAVTRFEHEDVI